MVISLSFKQQTFSNGLKTKKQKSAITITSKAQYHETYEYLYRMLIWMNIESEILKPWI